MKTGQAALGEIGRSYFDMVIAEAMHQAFLSGAHDCLIKPIDDNELLRIPALQRRALPQPELSIFHHS